MVGAVLVSLVLMLGVWAAQGQGTLVKLCGKDLVRTVISSCGNTISRRSALEFGLRRSPVDYHGSILDWLDGEQLARRGSSERGEEQASTERQPEEAKAAPGLPSMPPQLSGEVASAFSSSISSSASSRSRRSVKIEECCHFGCNLNELIWRYC